MPQAAVVASLKDQLVSARFGPDYLVVTFTLYIICCLQSKKEKSKSTFSLSFCRHYKDGQHSFRDQSSPASMADYMCTSCVSTFSSKSTFSKHKARHLEFRRKVTEEEEWALAIMIQVCGL